MWVINNSLTISSIDEVGASPDGDGHFLVCCGSSGCSGLCEMSLREYADALAARDVMFCSLECTEKMYSTVEAQRLVEKAQN